MKSNAKGNMRGSMAGGGANAPGPRKRLKTWATATAKGKRKRSGRERGPVGENAVQTPKRKPTTTASKQGMAYLRRCEKARNRWSGWAEDGDSVSFAVQLDFSDFSMDKHFEAEERGRANEQERDKENLAPSDARSTTRSLTAVADTPFAPKKNGKAWLKESGSIKNSTKRAALDKSKTPKPPSSTRAMRKTWELRSPVDSAGRSTSRLLQQSASSHRLHRGSGLSKPLEQAAPAAKRRQTQPQLCVLQRMFG